MTEPLRPRAFIQPLCYSRAGEEHAYAPNPVAQVRNQRSWEYGPFVNWGMGLGNRSDFKFLSGGFELGKVLSPVVHAGMFSGQFEFAGNIMPLWQAYTPAPHSRCKLGQPPGTT